MDEPRFTVGQTVRLGNGELARVEKAFAPDGLVVITLLACGTRLAASPRALWAVPQAKLEPELQEAIHARVNYPQDRSVQKLKRRLVELEDAVPVACQALSTLLEAASLGHAWPASLVEHVLGGRARVELALHQLLPPEARR